MVVVGAINSFWLYTMTATNHDGQWPKQRRPQTITVPK